jgi:hypothetical protein
MRGSRNLIMGPTRDANFSFGSHPVGINNAVINPQAINAPMLGMTMPLKNLPKDWTPIFIALPDINKPPNYMVLKLYIFKPQEIKAPLVGGGILPDRKPPNLLWSLSCRSQRFKRIFRAVEPQSMGIM